MVVRAGLACIGALVTASAAVAEPAILVRPGAYEVRVRLEMPNVQTRAAATTVTICLPDRDGRAEAPFPVLSGNNPLAACPVRNVRRDGSKVGFEIVCQGRDGARGEALYKLMPEAFRGRIAMVMGGKNMTMTEVQTGRRVGECAANREPDDPAR